MHLIALKDGTFLNPAHVVQYVRRRNGETQFLLSTGGEKVGETWEKHLEGLFVPTFPANPGFVAIFADRAVDGGFTYRRRSIIAWERCAAGNYPLFEGCHVDEDYDVIVDPDGGVFDSDGNMFATVDEWKASFEQDFGATKRAA